MLNIFKKTQEAPTMSNKKKDLQQPQENQLQKKTNEQKERDIASIMKKTGWSYQQTVDEVEALKKQMGMTYFAYNKYNFHKIAEEDREARYKEILKKKQENKEKLAEAREHCINGVINETGWERDVVEAKIDEAINRTGCRYKEYLLYRFFELTEEEQDQIPIMSYTAKLTKKFNVNAEFARMLDDKARTNIFFSEFMKRPWCVNTDVTFTDFKKIFAKSTKVIYKPLEGIGGHGISMYEIKDGNYAEVFSEIVKQPKGVVEEYVVQHPDMSKLCASSVNTLRIVTICSKSKPVTPDGKYMDIAYGALRIGGGTDVVDNFHSGGMAAAIDLKTGELVTHAANMEGDTFIVHPVSGAKIKGFKIPFFDEAIQMVKDICAKEGVEGNLGWDICITEKGPVLIEANRGPGAILLIAPYIVEKKGMMRYVLDKYLNI